MGVEGLQSWGVVDTSPNCTKPNNYCNRARGGSGAPRRREEDGVNARQGSVGGTPAKMRHDERHGRWRRVKPSPRPVFRPVVIDLLLRSLFETGLGPNLCLLRVF